MRGEQAYHLLSAPALVRYARERADDLKLPTPLRDGDPALPRLRREIPRYVDACLGSADPSKARAATDLARRLGRNLAAILLALHRGDPINREARPDWPDDAWARWERIRHIRLGGGIVSGDLGDVMISAAGSALGEFGYGQHFHLEKSRHPQDMALLGAARYVPEKASSMHQAALCLDLGQTSAKRAIAHYVRDPAEETPTELARLDWLPAAPVAWRWRNSPDAGRNIDGKQVLDFVGRTIAEGYDRTVSALQALGLPRHVLSWHVAMSIAAYVRGGTLLGNGIYARMSRITDDVRPLIAARVAEIAGWRPIPLIIHDGTAAAAINAGTPNGAVIVIGTALGVGFTPTTETGLRRISRDLTVSSRDDDLSR